MANTFASALVPRILPGTLEVLREYCPMLYWASKDYSGAASMLGDTVTMQKGVALAAGDVTPAMIAPSPSDIAPGYVTLSISNWKKASFGLTQKEYAEIIAGNTIPFQVQEAIRTVVNQVSASMWAGYTRISNISGYAGTGCVASNSVAYIADSAYKLDRALCPKGNRRLFISLRDAADLRQNTAYGQFYYVGESGQDNILRSGAFKSFYEYKTVEQDSAVPVHTVGTLGGGTVALAADAAAGAESVSVTVTGGSGLALKAGDVITIPGTGATLESGNARNQYSLTADATIAAAGTGTLYLNRGLTSAKVSTNAVTLGYTDGSHAIATSVQNIGGDPTGIGVVMRFPAPDMMGNRTAYESVPLIDPETGAVLCLTHLGGYHMSMWEVSALYGTAVVDERKLCRIVSYTALSA